MARSFVAASSQYLTTGSSPVAGPPFTMSCWALRTVSDGSNDAVFGLGDALSVSKVAGELNFRGWSGFDDVQHYAVSGATADNIVTSTKWTAGQWHHLAGVCSSWSSRSVFLDGGGKASGTASLASFSIVDLHIGQDIRSNVGSYADGKIADVAVWDVALSDAEIQALAAGASPLLIRPASLVFYLPMRKGDSLTDWASGITMTNNGTTESVDHPPVWYPSKKVISRGSAIVAVNNGNEKRHRRSLIRRF